ncbi:hypothetical protein FJT64_022580 [Amphibalanus amphitrite]|uniref:Uncharacterized protein n=1 Tax=Amphibalanus amphitrite TaxID=1232801 RepID=A0A6A4WUT5_AMPAM|nr:hypothetical protein FJT64_022580 [Amphibalanus amphitrite]
MFYCSNKHCALVLVVSAAAATAQHSTMSTDKLASARGGEAPGAEAVFLQAHRLLSTCDKLRHGARHVTAQLELLQRERARLALLVSDARGHAAAGER